MTGQPLRIAQWVFGLSIACFVGLAPFYLHRDSPPQRSHQITPPLYAPTPPAVFPLHMSADHRYLVDDAGAPFRIQTEAWVMSTRVTAPQLDIYLADRKARGFNGFLIMAVMPEAGTYGWSRRNAAGDEPFTTIGHLDTPNDKYFDFIELIIDKAAAQGMVVEMFYTYVGFGGGSEGWWSTIADPYNTQAVCFGWGQYLGNRFKNKTNLIWMAGGDYTMPAGETLTRVHKIHEGIRAAGAYQLAGSEWGYPDSLVTDQQGFTYGTDPHTSDLQLNSFYGQGPGQNGQNYDTAERAWANSPVLPAFNEEPVQAYSSYTPLDSGRAAMRKYQHWSIVAGGTAGSVWGLWAISDWHPDWQDWLDDPASIDQSRAFGFYQDLPWYLMRPSGTRAGFAGRDLVVSGVGSGNSRVVSSVTSTGSHLIVYVPPTGTAATTFSVDLRSMSGNSRGRWWNPTTGGYAGIAGGGYTFANTSSAQSFTTPGNNGTGSNDWMLVLDANTGSSGSGGASGAGGAAPTGGASSTGGAASNGGAGGRVSSTGGAGGRVSSTGGAGGGVSSNGGAGGGLSSNGGASGASANGGASGSSSTNGGASGSVSVSGGAGGATNGGAGAGNPSGNGGSTNTGGRVASAGGAGRPGSTAGSPSAGDGGSSGQGPGDASAQILAATAEEGSCSCTLAREDQGRSLFAYCVPALALLLRRRRESA